MAKKIKQKQRPYLSSEASASMEFLRSFLRRHFAGKPEVASRNSGFFSQARFPSNNTIHQPRLQSNMPSNQWYIMLASSKFGQRRLVLKN